MNRFILTIIILMSFTVLFIGSNVAGGHLAEREKTFSFYIEWSRTTEGTIEVANGKLGDLNMLNGEGETEGNAFSFTSGKRCRLGVTVVDARLQPGPEPTVITVDTEEKGFSFLLRDVGSQDPIFIPEYEVAVLPAGDNRTLSEIQQKIEKEGLRTKLEQIEDEPEESFEKAASHTRNQSCPTWLGVSRDFRIFAVDFGLNYGSQTVLNLVNYFHGEMESIRPKRAGRKNSVKLPETDNRPVTYNFIVGLGIGVVHDVSRHLEKGYLPILHTDIRDGDILYKTRAFVTLEDSPLTSDNLRGTHYLVADGYSAGHMFTDEQQSQFDKQEKVELNRKETTVLCFRAKAVNTSKAPRYAWFKIPTTRNDEFNAEEGFSQFSKDRVFCVARLNDKPVPFKEVTVLLAPGESAVFEFYVPHTPVTHKRADALAGWDFEKRLKECRSFWENKLSAAASINLPEQRIEEMVKAGLLHLDLITYGLEPEGTLAPTIGIYAPIGSESSPIIQFMNSMGWHETARRSLQYFLDKQHENGFIQNFSSYMVETGAALWSMGEYFRYTHDTEFVKKNKDKILKACNFLINRRDNNKLEKLKGKGYGMMKGKVADPEDPYYVFMLNGYNYLGISRAAEMLETIDPAESEKLRAEAKAYKKDIRESFFASMERSPVMPLGDGTWRPTVPPWPDTRAPLLLYLAPEQQYTHGTFTTRDDLLGPLYLVFQEVISPCEPAAEAMLAYQTEHYYQRNSAFTQPYYSRHAWVQLKRGMVKPFLKTYYNTFSALADRETYTFWEHLSHVSPHKTHEEGWFLMQTRWMLYMEEGQMLKLLPGVPRAWLEDGKTISVKDVASYFGSLSFRVKSNVEKGFIEATVDCKTDRKPEDILIRLPHPQGQNPEKVTGGVYDANTETVHVKSFTGHAEVRVEY